MASPYAAEFCTVLVSVIFTANNAHGEKLQVFWPATGILETLMRFAHHS